MTSRKHLALTTVFLSTCFALSASAGDINTYRPGQAYLKSNAHTPDQCAIQCHGDAQCRGWNFVVPNATAKSGVCEFNARAVSPVFSAISISGSSQSQIDPLMSRAIQGGTRTIRVGSPHRVIEPRNQKQAQTPQSRRIIKRQPKPQSQKSILPASLQTPPAFASRQVNPQSPQIPSQQQVLTYEQARHRQAFIAAQKRQHLEQFQRAQQLTSLQTRPQSPQFQHMRAPQIPPQNNQRHRQMPQKTQIPATPQISSNKLPAPRAQFNPMQSVQAPSLFGNLHDDLPPMTSVPRPQTAPDNPGNPDAPISTAIAAPTKPVETETIRNSAISGLAGG